MTHDDKTFIERGYRFFMPSVRQAMEGHCGLYEKTFAEGYIHADLYDLTAVDKNAPLPRRWQFRTQVRGTGPKSLALNLELFHVNEGDVSERIEEIEKTMRALMAAAKEHGLVHDP